MGNTLQSFFKVPDQGGADISPSFRSPLTDVTAPILHWDDGPCTPFEAQYLECTEAYGNIKSMEECKLYYLDLVECAHNVKKSFRIEAMMDERWRQYVKGQLGLGPMIPRFAEPAPVDGYAPATYNNY